MLNSPGNHKLKKIELNELNKSLSSEKIGRVQQVDMWLAGRIIRHVVIWPAGSGRKIIGDKPDVWGKMNPPGMIISKLN